MKKVRILALMTLVLAILLSLTLPAAAASEADNTISAAEDSEIIVDENISTGDSDLYKVDENGNAIAIGAVPMDEYSEKTGTSAETNVQSGNISSETDEDGKSNYTDDDPENSDDEVDDEELQTVISSTPLAEMYFYNHSTTSGSGWTVYGVDTTGYKTAITNSMNTLGYNACSYTNVQAGPSTQPSVIRTLQNDAFFSIIAHGMGGAVFCVDNSNNLTLITANTTSLNDGYSLQSNFSGTTDKLRNVRVAWWMGCNTYSTDSTYGSLPSMCSTLGVDCVITHNSLVYVNYGPQMMFMFTVYGNGGYSAGSSLAYARAYVMTHAGYSEPYDTTTEAYITTSNYCISGADLYPASVAINPAAYGTY